MVGCFQSIKRAFTAEARQRERADPVAACCFQGFWRALHGGDGFGEAAELTAGSCPRGACRLWAHHQRDVGEDSAAWGAAWQLWGNGTVSKHTCFCFLQQVIRRPRWCCGSKLQVREIKSLMSFSSSDSLVCRRDTEAHNPFYQNNPLGSIYPNLDARQPAVEHYKLTGVVHSVPVVLNRLTDLSPSTVSLLQWPPKVDRWQKLFHIATFLSYLCGATLWCTYFLMVGSNMHTHTHTHTLHILSRILSPYWGASCDPPQTYTHTPHPFSAICVGQLYGAGTFPKLGGGGLMHTHTFHPSFSVPSPMYSCHGSIHLCVCGLM